KAGFKAVEFPPPYKGGAEPQQIADLVKANGLHVVLINAPAQVGTVGGRGLACLPGEQTAFQQSAGTALEYARALGAKRVHIQSGTTPDGADHETCLTTYRDNV